MHEGGTAVAVRTGELGCGPLAVRAGRERGRRVVFLRGELDLPGTLVVQQQLDLALADEASEAVVVDMRGLEFIDSSGIALLLRALTRDWRRRLRFVLSESPAVMRTLEMTGVAGQLPAVA